jgi:AhpD family alkylhydroperoxidase
MRSTPRQAFRRIAFSPVLYRFNKSNDRESDFIRAFLRHCCFPSPWHSFWHPLPVPANVLPVFILWNQGVTMSTFGLIEYHDASPQVRAIYDDIMATRKTDWINNFWKAIAHDPALLQRTWESIKQVMAPGALDPLTKELIYVAVSVTNNCHYCIASHTASAFGKGLTDAMFKELQAVIGMANETNKLVTGYQVEIDQRFQPPLSR